MRYFVINKIFNIGFLTEWQKKSLLGEKKPFFCHSVRKPIYLQPKTTIAECLSIRLFYVFWYLLQIPPNTPTIRYYKMINGCWRTESIKISPQNYDILIKMLFFCTSFSGMKEKIQGASSDALPICACTKKSLLRVYSSNVFFHLLKNIEKWEKSSKK